MIWAIFSDVHGNLEALGAVIEDCRQEGAQRIAFLGDAVGYGANPNECLAILEKLTDLRVAGNHDYGAVALTDISYFNPSARTALGWTQSTLTEENQTLLRNLTLVRQVGDIQLVHATPYQPAEWKYIFTFSDAEESFLHMSGNVAFIGHSHLPVILSRDPGGKLGTEEKTEAFLDPNRQYIINVGSIGQPRDHNPNAAYGLFDDGSRKYRLRRVSYDIQTAQKKILRAGLPPALAQRLAYGQ